MPAAIADAPELASEAELSAGLAPHVKELLEEQLIAESGPHRLSAYQSLERASVPLFEPEDRRAFGLTGAEANELRITKADAIDFFIAARKASHRLKTEHIRDLVRDVRSRKAVAQRAPTDVEVMRRHTAIFARLRPWYPRRYVCLYDALALVEFLARRRIFPTWVFGVQAQPFGAHCWIQSGEFLLNETTEYAGQFTPIMAV